MTTLTIELPQEILRLLGSEAEARREAKVAVVFDLVRQGKVSRSKAAELLELSLWDLPGLLARYRIPWFDCTPEALEADLQTLRTGQRATE